MQIIATDRDDPGVLFADEHRERHPLHVVEAAMIGAHVATIPFDVIKKLVTHPLTNSGLEKFLADWRAYEASLA